MKVIINESSVVKVLERVWTQDPYFDGDKLKMFGISPKNPSAQMLFQKFIGLEEMTKRAENIMGDFRGKDFNVDNCGTYDIDFKIEHMFTDEGYGGLQYIYINCNVDYGTSTAIIPFYDPNAERKSLSNVMDDEETAWEINSEIVECIESYFDEDLEIRKNTGMSVIAKLITIS